MESWERAELGLSVLGGGLFGEGLSAHSVRGESCNSDSSPEPAADCLEEGVLGGAGRERVRGGGFGTTDGRGWFLVWEAQSVAPGGFGVSR